MAQCNEKCTCPKIECENHGKCCACINYHRECQTLVYCMRNIKDK
ncbi:hypothetical protein Q428_07275 [Fervidicella metallireducens AeB]|uniref:Uncharacterized protein n=1 Tax=Fervidicella metallireducens AeB TaxID=1403537 RepID=A0A017RUZ7_9CLOT|nr:hypothetical protein [Fervidicella metallireducens]EYE88558.1 hypothetical protein Q428_07275 [Fervidicella metallireducens AeB]